MFVGLTVYTSYHFTAHSRVCHRHGRFLGHTSGEIEECIEYTTGDDAKSDQNLLISPTIASSIYMFIM
jgi:hypothetical protein